MSELQLLFMALPWVVATVLPWIAVALMVVGRRAAPWWALGYYLLLACFPNASWGLLETAAGQNFYTRGSGLLYFSAINILLWGLVLQALVARSARQALQVKHNLGWVAKLFWMMLSGHTLIWATLPDVPWYQLLAYQGLLNVVNLMLAFYVLTASLREPGDLQRMVDLLLVCIALRGLWGLVRFGALGGDPANFYENFQKINIKITFFDINDSLLATMAVFLATWRLAHGLVEGRRMRWAHGGLIALELFIVLFSQRRTAWGGLVLVFLLFAWIHRGPLRWGLLSSLTVLGAPLLAYKLIQRSGHTAAGGSWIEKMAPDIFVNGQLSFTTGRFAELYAAWIHISESPWLGLGAWGRYDGFRFSELAWHHGDFGWMHSGFLHIMLKTGLLGLTLMLVAVVLYFRFVLRSAASMPPSWRGMLWMGFAGTLFMLPTWLLGTPVIEYRTMQLLALCLALPYMAVAASRSSTQGSVVARPTRSVRWGIRPPSRVHAWH